MKTLAVVCALVLGVTACVACSQLRYKGSNVPFTSQETIASTPTAVQELQGPAPDSIQDDDKFYVSMEVVYHASQAAKYPVTADALRNALGTWAESLPVRLTLYVEDPNPPKVPFFPFPAASFVNRWNIVEILLDDLQGPPYNMQRGVLGVWLSAQNRIVLDADTLESDPSMAYSVALHELGHMFGVPHLVGWARPAYSGWLVVPSEKDAEAYVMYPARVEGKSQDRLSRLEIDIAKHYLLHMLTSPGESHTIQECNLTHGPCPARMDQEDPCND